jgi:hypothetical protein
MYTVRLWKKCDNIKKVRRFNGGSWFAELVEDNIKSYKTIATFTLISGSVIEVVEALPQAYLDKIIQEDLIDTWISSEITNISEIPDISDQERERISKWLGKDITEDTPFQIPKAKSIQTSREKALPSRKSPAHISGRLMGACLIDDCR